MNRQKHDHPWLARAALLGMCWSWMPIAPVAAQEPTDPAKLVSAVQLFDEGDYAGAQHALQQVDSRNLDEAERDRLNDYLQRVVHALSRQAQAEKDLEAAVLAITESRLQDATALLEGILENEFAGRALQAEAERELVALAARQQVPASQDAPPAQVAPPTPTRTEPPVPTDESLTVGAADPDRNQLRMLRAKVLTRDGMAALAAGRLSDAERLFQEALSNVPGYPEAEQGMQQLGGHERVESGAENLLSRIKERNAVAWQRTVATFRELEAEVRGHVLSNRYPTARQAMLRARQVVEGGKGFAEPVALYEAMLRDAEALQRYVDDEERLYNDREVSRQREDARVENQQRHEEIRENRERRITALMNQAADHRKDQDFDAAISVLAQVLAIDPHNNAARWTMDSLEDQRAYYHQRALREEFMKQTQNVLIDVDDSKIPWWQDITYPKNWREIISRPTRIPPGSESRGIDPSLQSSLNTPVRIDFRGDPLGEVIERLAQTGKTNISVSWPSLDSAGIHAKTPVQLTLNNPVSLGTALREVLDSVNASSVELDYLPVDGVVKVASKDVLDRTVFEAVYDVSDLLMPVPDFNDAPRMDLVHNDLPSSRRLASGGGDRTIFPGDEEGSTEIINEQANELVTLIRTTVDPSSWRSGGGDIGSITEINGQLVITQTPSAHARVGGLLSKLREQLAIQIAVEARFITVQSNYLEEMGLDLDVVLNAGNAGFDFVAGGGGTLQVDPVLGSRLLMPRSFSRLGFTPTAPGVGSTLTTTGPSPQPFGEPGFVPQSGNNFIGGQNASPLPVISNILQFTDPGTLTNDLPGSFAGNPTLQPAFQVFGSFLDNIQVDFLVRATQADSRTSLLTAPRLVLSNGQLAWVAVVNQQSFVSSLQPVVDAQGQAPVISTIETGAVLEARATVSADRRYVKMTLRPSVGRLLGIQTFGFSLGPNVGEGSFVQLPNITRTVVRTTVSVPDEGTLLIGGQKLSGEIEVESGVPILSKIPILKRLYTSKTLVKDEQVLLILIKPKVIIQSESEEAAFPSFSMR